jgi:hypothetical protein
MNPISPTRRGTRLRYAALAAGATGVLLVASCATPPPPTASLQAAQLAISTAEQAEAGRYAPGEMAEARIKLASANSAVSDKNMVQAQQLAEQASAEAQLAAARTADVKANAVNDEMKRSTTTLYQETQRKSGDQP